MRSFTPGSPADVGPSPVPLRLYDQVPHLHRESVAEGVVYQGEVPEHPLRIGPLPKLILAQNRLMD